ncbi:MAG: nuclear transport factor 2 family protein [Bacteroidota bacterium]
MNTAISTNEITLNTAQAFLGAMGSRNLDAITALFAEQVDWFIPGDEILAPWLGKREDREGVRDFFSLLWPATEPLSAQVDHLFVDGDKAVVIGEFSTRMLATGKVVDSLFHIHLTVENGLITRYRLLEDSLAVYRALGG